MARDEEVEQLIADVCGVEIGAEHRVEHVVVAAQADGAAFGHDLVGQAVQIGRVAAHPALGEAGDGVGQEGLPQHAHVVRTLQRRDHVVAERVGLLGGEAAEGVSRRAATDGLQGGTRRVRRDVDRAALTRPVVPAGGEFGRDVEHDRVVAPHGGLAEGRHQQVVGTTPVRLVVVRGEQPVAADHPQRLDVGPDVLAESRLVVEVRTTSAAAATTQRAPRNVNSKIGPSRAMSTADWLGVSAWKPNTSPSRGTRHGGCGRAGWSRW